MRRLWSLWRVLRYCHMKVLAGLFEPLLRVLLTLSVPRQNAFVKSVATSETEIAVVAVRVEFDIVVRRVLHAPLLPQVGVRHLAHRRPLVREIPVRTLRRPMRRD